MARFEVHIPAAENRTLNLTLRVEADHWMAALKTGLQKLGEQGASAQNVMVDISEDGSVHVTEGHSGRVFQIREIAETTAPAQAPPGAQTGPAAPKAQPSSSDRRPSASVLKPERGGLPSEDRAPTLLNFPTGASRRAIPTPRPLKALSVMQLEHPTRPLPGRIGRAASANREPREQIEDRLANLFDEVQQIYSQPNEESALYFLLDLALKSIPAEAGSVLLAHAVSGDLSFAAARGPKAQELLQSRPIVPAGVGIAGFCSSEGVSLALSEVQNDLRWYSEISERLKYQTKSVLCAPMMTHGRAWGCMQLINRKESDVFTEHEAGMLSYLAHQGALYLNSRV
jgi:hypothetical protein